MPLFTPPRARASGFLSFFLFGLFTFYQSVAQNKFVFFEQTPQAITDNDHKATVGHEVGLKFNSSSAGFITGIRFFKTAGNTGTHIGELYSPNGTRLAQATFINETATGWQYVYFSTAIQIVANTTYTAAYFSSLGNYTEDNDYFKTGGVSNIPLSAPVDGTHGASGTDPGSGQGTYKYTSSPAFPNQLYRSANYWVDPIFTTTLSPLKADAGADQTINGPTSSLFLDGNHSTGNITSYLWKQVSGPSMLTITGANNINAHTGGFIQGVYIFELSVNGGASTDQVTITANIPPPPAPFLPDATVMLPLNTIQLIDVVIDAGLTTAFHWSQVSGPNQATILNPGNNATNAVGLIAGDYVFKLDVSGPGGTNSGTFKVKVIPPGLAPNIFGNQIPAEGVTTVTDGGREFGVKFKSAVAGYIRGIRFYKGVGNNGTHVGELYTTGGSRLAQATFTGETASGWQTVNFTSPVAIDANTIYVAAYFSPNGTGTGTPDYFFNNHDAVNYPLTAPHDGAPDVGSNGVFNVGNAPVFPIGVHPNGTNNWVDVVFSNGGTVTANAGLNQLLFPPTSTASLTGSGSSGPISSYLWTLVSGPTNIFEGPLNVVINSPTSANTTVSGLRTSHSLRGDDQGFYVFQLSVNGGQSISQVTIHVLGEEASAGPDQTITFPQSSVTLNGSASIGTITKYEWKQIAGDFVAHINTPFAVSTTATSLVPGVYTFQLTINDGATSTMKVTVNPPVGTPMHIFTTQTPLAITDNDHKPTVGQEVGLKFTSSSAGIVTGVRFYKTTGNTGIHIGELYAANGTRLAQVSFNNETSTGWQYADFASPVIIAANTSYTVAYFSSQGNYTEDNDYFLHHSVTNAPLTAPADGTNGISGTDPGNGQGTYLYTASPAFPNKLYRSANYWVDISFIPSANTMSSSDKPLSAKASDEKTDSAGVLTYTLSQNFPNPSTGMTEIDYSIPKDGQVELKLFDLQGRPIKTLVSEVRSAGKYSYQLNTGILAKGLYLYSMHSGTFHAVKKLVVQ